MRRGFLSFISFSHPGQTMLSVFVNRQFQVPMNFPFLSFSYLFFFFETKSHVTQTTLYLTT